MWSCNRWKLLKRASLDSFTPKAALALLEPSPPIQTVMVLLKRCAISIAFTLFSFNDVMSRSKKWFVKLVKCCDKRSGMRDEVEPRGFIPSDEMRLRSSLWIKCVWINGCPEMLRSVRWWQGAVTQFWSQNTSSVVCQDASLLQGSVVCPCRCGWSNHGGISGKN